MTNRALIREFLPLAGITTSAFVFNSSEFMPIGLLTDIGASFGTSEAQTGMLVTIYAWAVMLLSLPLMIAATRIAFRKLLLLVLVVFLIGQAASACAPSFGALMLGRLVVACAHSVFWAIAAPIAVRVVAPNHQALALSAIQVGTAVALVAGLPLGRSIGVLLGWRLTFACVGAITALLILYMARVMPLVSGAEKFEIRQLGGLFKNKALVAIFVLTTLYSLGYYTAYSYIEPFLAQVARFSSAEITLALCVFGVMGFVASVLCAKCYSRFRFPFIVLVLVGISIALLGLEAFAAFLPTILAACALWGLASASYSVSIQAEVIRVTPVEEQTVAMAIFSGLFNLGIGTGAFLGGHVVDTIGIEGIGIVGGILTATGLAFCVLVLIPQLKRQAR